MNYDPQWEPLSLKVFKPTETRAPAFLWTRILAAIEAREASAWWYQWRWMSRVAMAMALLVSLGAGLVFYEAAQGTPLENLLNGVTTPQQAGQLLSQRAPDNEETVAMVLNGGSSWQEN